MLRRGLSPLALPWRHPCSSVKPLNCRNLGYVLLVKGAFSGVLEGVALKMVWGQAPEPLFLLHFSNVLPTFYAYCRYKTMRNDFPKLLNTIQRFPVNIPLNKIFIRQSPKRQAKSTMTDASYAPSRRKLVAL